MPIKPHCGYWQSFGPNKRFRFGGSIGSKTNLKRSEPLETVRIFGLVAQLGEQRLCKPKVVGSNPIRSTNTTFLQEIEMKSKDQKIEQIHNEFDAGAELALSKAHELINMHRPGRVHMLTMCGARQQPELSSNGEFTENSPEFADNVREVLRVIPDAKMLSLPQLSAICKKYGLVTGPLKRFVSRIPTPNLVEMYEFRIHCEKLVRANALTGRQDKDLEFYVAARKKDFKLREDETFGVDENTFFKRVPPDPVVLFPTRRGVIIVTKWGKEADYEEFN